MSSSNQKFDDLTIITGIGNSIQEQLRTRLEIRNYADLAALSVDTISANLKTEKSIPSPLKTRKKIKQWVDEAKELAEQKDAPSKRTKDLWEPIDSFVVEFQSKKGSQGEFDLRIAVQHVEHDANKHWGFREDQEWENLFSWMKNEANLDKILKKQKVNNDKSAKYEQITVDEAADFSWESDVKPTQISLSQGEEVETTSIIDEQERPFLAHVHHEMPLDLEVTFSLPSTPTTGDNSLRYNAQCQIHNLSQKLEPTIMEMGTTNQFGDKPSISAKLTDVSLEPGIYELGILVRGERPLGANYYEFPKLNVL